MFIRGLDSLDVGAEGPQLFVEALVAAVYVVDVGDLRSAGRCEAREDECGAGSDVQRLHTRAVQRRRPANDSSGGARRHYVGAHLLQLAGVEEAVVEDALVDVGDAVGLGEEDGDHRLEVGGEAGIGERLDGDGAQFGSILRTQRRSPSASTATPASRSLWVSDSRCSGRALADFDLAAGEGGGDRVGARFEAVGDDLVLAAAQAFDALDLDGVGAGAGDARAHAGEHLGGALDFGLGGGVDDARAAAGGGGGEHEVLRAEHAGVVGRRCSRLRAAPSLRR